MENQAFEHFSVDSQLTHLKNRHASITQDLFQAVYQPNRELLIKAYPVLLEKIKSHKLSVESVSLMQQRCMPWLLFKNSNFKFECEGLLSVEGAWTQVHALLKARDDALTIHALVEQLQENEYALTTESFGKIVSDVEQLSDTGDSARWLQIHSVMKEKQSKSEHDGSWSRIVLASRANKLLSTFSIFRTATHDVVKDDEKLKQLNKERNEFWRQYFISGKVPYAWLVLPSKQKLVSSFGNVISLDEADGNGVALCFQVGRYLIMEKAALDGISICELPKEFTDLSSTVKKLYTETPTLKYKFSSAGYWQYRVSSLLKKTTNFMPRRSDYLK